MSAMSRNKGAGGERELANLLADLTGWDVRRRVRQHGGDSDLEGVAGWSVEVKRHARAPTASISTWYAQSVRQAQAGGLLPVLFYREDRQPWRAVWPLSALLIQHHAAMWTDYLWTAETSIEAWASAAVELTIKERD